MSGKYRYDHRTVKRQRYVAVAAMGCVLLLAGAIALVVLDLQKNSSGQAEGTSRVVGQVVGDNAAKKTIDEPFYSLQLPGDWKETSRTNNANEQSVTWTTTKKDDSQRSLQVFVDMIPATMPVNRMLPLTATGTTLTTGDVSENCATFTQGGTLDVQKAVSLSPTSARWQGVDFICNLPNVVDNQVGTSSRDGVNQITVTGATKGTHKYFFLYIDRNIQPDYALFLDALTSFRAK